MINIQELPKFTTSYDEEFKDYYHFKNGKVMAMSEVSDELNKQAEEIKRLTQQNSSLNICLSDQMERIAELEQENKGLSVALSMPTSVDALTTEAFALEQQAKALEELLTYPNHRFHGDSRLYYSEYSINRAIENLRKQAKGGDV